jgi:two-component system sensor histidine kinase DesK
MRPVSPRSSTARYGSAARGWRRSGRVLAEVLLLDYPVFVFALTMILAVAVFFGNHFFVENTRKRAELKLSRRVRASRRWPSASVSAATCTTCSAHAVDGSAEIRLAGKLLDRDPLAARREIDEVGRVARDALAQVRRAVSGIRAAGIAAELASAKLLLESDGVAFRYERADVPLTPELETVFALTLREAITNIAPRARARRVARSVDDDGAGDRRRRRGGQLVPGNGLPACAGASSRWWTPAGGSAAGRGTRIEARLPLPPAVRAPR